MLKANVSVWPFPPGLRMLNMHEGQGRREEQSCLDYYFHSLLLPVSKCALQLVPWPLEPLLPHQ